MIRVASYNIRKAVGLDWKRRPDRILGVLSEIDADVVALQEADRRFGRRRTALPVDMLADNAHGVADVAVATQSIGWHGNAILVREDRLSIVESARLELPALEPRGAVMTIVRTGDRMLRIVGVHLALLKRHRLRQLDALHAHIRRRDALPTVILGDFNEWGPKLSIEGFETVTPGNSFHAARPVAPLDRLLLSPDLTAATSGVHRSDLARVASDHLPVWANISLAGDGAS